MLKYEQKLAKIKSALSEDQHSALFNLYNFDAVTHSVPILGLRAINNDNFYDRSLGEISLRPIFSTLNSFHRNNKFQMKNTLKIIYKSKIYQAFRHFTGLDPWIVLNCSRIRSKKNNAQNSGQPEKVFIPWHRDAH